MLCRNSKDWEASRLVIHEEEAKRVRAIFALYLEAGSLSAAVRELRRRGWRNKRSMTRTGTPRGGAPFTKGTLHYLLTNVTYIGQVKYRGEIHQGEQPAIVAKEVFQRVQGLLAENRQQKTPGRRIRLLCLYEGPWSLCDSVGSSGPVRTLCLSRIESSLPGFGLARYDCSGSGRVC